MTNAPSTLRIAAGATDLRRRFLPLLLGFVVAMAVAAAWRALDWPYRVPVAISVLAVVQFGSASLLDGRAQRRPVLTTITVLMYGLAAFLWMYVWT